MRRPVISGGRQDGMRWVREVSLCCLFCAFMVLPLLIPIRFLSECGKLGTHTKSWRECDFAVKFVYGRNIARSRSNISFHKNYIDERTLKLAINLSARNILLAGYSRADETAKCN